MVNLIDHFMDKTRDEEKFKKNVADLLKYAAKGDEEFMNKSILAIRTIVKDKSVDSMPKYFLLQMINLCCQLGFRSYYEILASKFLSDLYEFARYDIVNPDPERKGRNCMKTINSDSNEEYSLRVYQLLIEMFGGWAEDPIASSFEIYSNNYNDLMDWGIEFPSKPKYLYAYSELISELKKGIDQGQASSLNKSNGHRVAKSLNKMSDEEFSARFHELKSLRKMIHEYLEKNKESTLIFDDYFQLIEEQLADLERGSNSIQTQPEYQITRKYLLIYKQNEDDYDEIRKQLYKIDEDALKDYKKANLFKDTSLDDQANVSSTSNPLDFRKKTPSNAFGDVISNKSININSKKLKEKVDREPKNPASRLDNSENNGEEENDDLLMEFLRTERGFMANKIRELERKATSLKSESDRFQKKVNDQEITIKSLQSRLEVADKENQHYKKIVESFVRELSIKMKADAIKSKGMTSVLRPQTYDFDHSSGLGGGYSSKLDLDAPGESRLERPLSSFDQRNPMTDLNRMDPSIQRSRLTDYTRTNLKADYGMEDLHNRSLNANRPKNLFSNTADSFYNRERPVDDLGDFKSKLHGSNDFLKGFNQDIESILKKERTGSNINDYYSSNQALKQLPDKAVKSFYGNDSSYYNTSYKLGDNNVYKREGIPRPQSGQSSLLDAYANKYSGRGDQPGLSRTLGQNNRLDISTDRLKDGLTDSKQVRGVLMYKNS